MTLPGLETADIKNKTIFVRGDIDVPLKDGKIIDDTRLQDIFPTIEYLLKEGCQIILAGHLGRPGGKEDLNLSSKVVAEWFKNKLNEIGNISGVCLKGNICGFLVSDKLTVLENLRFDPREETNDEDFAKELASLAQVYVNEAFATSHDLNASIVQIPKLLPHFAGFRLVKEMEVLGGIAENPKRPLIVVVGGAKLDTKLPVLKKLAELADRLVVGGKLIEETVEKIPEVLYLELTPDGKDSTEESVGQCEIILAYAQTIVWNGPLGQFEDYSHQVGTRWIAELIARSRALKVVGGGDTLEFLRRNELINNFDFVSSGGGALLHVIAGEKLPGVEALLL